MILRFDSSFYNNHVKREKNKGASPNEDLCLDFYTAYSHIYDAMNSNIKFNNDDECEVRRNGTYDVIKGVKLYCNSVRAIQKALSQKGMRDPTERNAIIAAILQSRGKAFFQLGSIFDGFILEATNFYLRVSKTDIKLSVDYNKYDKETIISYEANIFNKDNKNVGNVKAVITIKNNVPKLTTYEITIDKTKAEREVDILKANIANYNLPRNSKEWKTSSSAKFPEYQIKKVKSLSEFFARILNLLSNLSKKFEKDEVITLKPSVKKPVLTEVDKQQTKTAKELTVRKPIYANVKSATQNEELQKLEEKELQAESIETKRLRI